MNDSQADSLQTRKSERNVARAAKCATDKGLGKTCDVPGKGSKPIVAFLAIVGNQNTAVHIHLP